MSVNGLIPYDHPSYAAYDHMAYLAMARDGIGAPGQASTPPFCWRVLTPWLAGRIPAPLPVSFFILSFLAVAGCALAIYALCRRQGHPPAWSFAGMGLYFCCFWAAGFSLWNYIMLDAFSLLFCALGLLLLESRDQTSLWRRWALVALLVVAALHKESWLVPGAAVAVVGWRRAPGTIWRRSVRALLPLVPAVAAMVVVRLAINADPAQPAEFSDYSLPSVFLNVVQVRLESLFDWVVGALYDPWGPLVFAPLVLAPREAVRWLRRYPHRTAMLAMAFAQTLFATALGRLVVVALPVVILYVVDRLREDAGPRPAVPLGALFALQFVFQYARRTTFGLGTPPYTPNTMILVAYAVRAAAMLLSIPAWLWLKGPLRPRWARKGIELAHRHGSP